MGFCDGQVDVLQFLLLVDGIEFSGIGALHMWHVGHAGFNIF